MAIFFNVYRTMNVESLLYRLLKNPHKYPNFHFLAFWQTQYNNMIAVNVFISWVKVITAWLTFYTKSMFDFSYKTARFVNNIKHD